VLERGKYFDVTLTFKTDVYDELKFDRHSDIFQTWRDTLTFATKSRRRCRCASWCVQAGEMAVYRGTLGRQCAPLFTA